MVNLGHIACIIVVVAIATLTPTSNAITPDVIRTVVEKGKRGMTQSQSGNVTEPCRKALDAWLFGPDTGQKIQVLDAFGKVEAGYLAGNVRWLGHFDECMNITDFKYCATFITANLEFLVHYPLPVPMEWGVCVPENCTEGDVQLVLTELLEVTHLPAVPTNENSSVSCASDPPYPLSDAGFIGTMTLFSIIFFLMLVGAAYDYYLRYVQERSNNMVIYTNSTVGSISNGNLDAEAKKAEPNTTADDARLIELPKPPKLAMWEQFLLSFAINRNLVKLLSTKTSDRSIGCLNGIRVLSMSWVILGHTFFFPLEMGVTDNVLFGLEWNKRFGFQAISNAFFSVDSFFFLSGVLLAYITLTKMAKTNGRIPWHWFYFHRYWRLTPAVLVTTLIWMYIKPYMGNGPNWKVLQNVESCSNYWWTNILYINNFYPSKFADECIGWVWYLANDMQFFVISPLILIPLYFMPWLGITIIMTLLLASFAATGTIVGIHNFGFNGATIPGQKPPTPTGIDWSSVVYGKPYCRIGPYLVGMMLGYFLYRQGERKLNLNPALAALGWAVASAIGMSCVYGINGGNNGESYTLAASVLYNTLSRFAWGVALAWVVVACREGYGGWVNSMLSWSGWLPLSRITYSAYLLHPIVIYIFFGNLTNSINASLWLMPTYFVAFLAMSYAAAVLMGLFIEFPFGGLEKLFMPTRQA